MEEVFEFLKFIAERFGVVATIVVIILLIIFYIMVKNPRMIRRGLSWLENRSHKITKKKLKRHQVFNKKHDYLHRVKFIKFPGEYYKTELVKLFLSTKIKVKINLMRCFLNTDKLKGTHKFKLQQFMYNLMDDMNEEFNTIIKQELRNFVRTHVAIERPNYTDKELDIFNDKLYDHIMNDENGWNEKQHNRLKRIHSHIEEIPVNDIYSDNYERTHRLFDILNVAIDSEINDATKIYSRMNGWIQNEFRTFIKGHR